MKRYFIYVLMAAAALTTCTLAACSDDDDDIDSSADYDEGDVAEDGDYSEFIMEHVVVMDDEGQFVRYGLYGGNKSENDTTSMVYYLEDDDTYESIFRSLVPGELKADITGSGETLSLQYEQDGKQYSLTMKPAADGVLITLPSAEPWSKYATAIEVKPAPDDNALKGTNADYYYMGLKYEPRFITRHIKMLTYRKDSPDYYTMVDIDRNYEGKVEFLCIGKSANAVWFAFTASDYDENENQIHNGNDYRYIAKQCTTNEVYDRGEEFLPKAWEIQRFKKNFLYIYINFLMRNGNTDNTPKQIQEDYEKPFGDQFFELLHFNENVREPKFATSEKDNPLLNHKKVKYVDFAAPVDDPTEVAWKNKNSQTKLSILYILRVLPEDLCPAMNQSNTIPEWNYDEYGDIYEPEEFEWYSWYQEYGKKK